MSIRERSFHSIQNASHQKLFRLKNHLAKRPTTLLGIGPVSPYCVDVGIELANAHRIPLIFIASRRQIDADCFGGGYVNRWTTEEFCRYVKSKDTNNQVLLARDHGGPWQSEYETRGNFTLDQALASAKTSYQVDIASGMDILHLDPGHDEKGKATVSFPDYIDRTKELLVFCHKQAEAYGKEIAIEIGTEEGLIGAAHPEETEEFLQTIVAFCEKESLPLPNFLVVQTGTKVMEMRNVGPLTSLIKKTTGKYIPPSLSRLVKLCNIHGLLIKEHNADYLGEETLRWHPSAGIHVANVAPEFGVVETTAFLNLLKQTGLQHLHEKTLSLSFQSQKWKKWMVEDTQASDFERALIAGHYIFSTPEFLEIKKEATARCQALQINLEQVLKDAIRTSMMRYIRNFGLIS